MICIVVVVFVPKKWTISIYPAYHGSNGRLAHLSYLRTEASAACVVIQLNVWLFCRWVEDLIIVLEKSGDPLCSAPCRAQGCVAVRVYVWKKKETEISTWSLMMIWWISFIINSWRWRDWGRIIYPWVSFIRSWSIEKRGLTSV